MLTSVIRKLQVTGLVTLVGLLISFIICFNLGCPAMMIGYSAAVVLTLVLVSILTCVTFIGDMILAKMRWKTWINLVICVVPVACVVYYYFLWNGESLDDPLFSGVSYAALWGSLILAIVYWIIDELSWRYNERMNQELARLQALGEQQIKVEAK